MGLRSQARTRALIEFVGCAYFIYFQPRIPCTHATFVSFQLGNFRNLPAAVVGVCVQNVYSIV